MLSNWERGGSARPAEQRRCKQLCQCKHGSRIICEGSVSGQASLTLSLPASGASLEVFWSCFPTWVQHNYWRSRLLIAADLSALEETPLRLDAFFPHLRWLAAVEGASVDTADPCYSKRNIWPCLFSQIDLTLCFKFIFICHGKYVSPDPLCTPCTDSTPHRATGPAWSHGIASDPVCFKWRTSN